MIASVGEIVVLVTLEETAQFAQNAESHIDRSGIDGQGTTPNCEGDTQT